MIGMPFEKKNCVFLMFNKLTEVSIASYMNYLDPFSSFSITNLENNNLRISIYYKPGQKLIGDMHIDAPLLAGTEVIINYLKYNRLLKNQESVVYSSYELPYQEVRLNYNPNYFGTINSTSIEPTTLISQTTLYKEHLEIEAVSEHVMDFIRDLKFLMKKLGFNENVTNKQRLSRKLTSKI